MILKFSTRRGQPFFGEREIESRHLLYFHRIKGYSYDKANGILSIDFHDGRTREYCQVPDAVYQKLKLAADENKYFDKYIYGSYPVN